MRSYVVFTLLISLLNLKSSSNSKPENPLESQVEIFCINLYSECCGTDIEISKLVISLEKKYNKSFIKTVKYWGKEGEQLFIYSPHFPASPLPHFPTSPPPIRLNVKLSIEERPFHHPVVI